MMNRLRSGEASIAVVGLGYVGLPLARALAEEMKVVGYDINSNKVREIMASGESFEVSSDPAILESACCYIIAVPTPIDDNRVPVLDSLVNATRSVGAHLDWGDYVIYESTVYPGCTEEMCIPLLKAESGMAMGKDFKVCYSPERISPGDRDKDIRSLVKVISACDEEALNQLEELYGPITGGLHRASSIKVAEMSKLAENVQRDVNISLINEFAMICDRIGLDTHEVLDAASSKWNFQRFTPGLVGGHCISVDPYYLVYKSEQVGHTPRVILSGRDINDNMPGFIVKKLLKKLIATGKNPGECRVLVLGITFKPDIADIRNSKVVDVINELESYSIDVDTMDPKADREEVREVYGVELVEAPEGLYDAVIVAVPHCEFLNIPKGYFNQFLNGSRIVMDVSGRMSDAFEAAEYWRL